MSASLLENKTKEIRFAGHTLLLDGSGALFWPEERLLIVSDLHLEKASFLAQFGSLLPRYDTRDTLRKLARVIGQYQPERVVCLGDSFHDRQAFARLDAEDREALLQLAREREWHWVLGNHDPELPSDLPGQQHAQLTRQGLALRHEPEGDAPQIIGHFHPKIAMRLGGHKVNGPAFAHDARILIMPAFGSFTGGLDVRHEAIAATVRNPVCYLLYREKIWKVGR